MSEHQPSSRSDVLTPEAVRDVLLGVMAKNERVSVCAARPVHITYDQRGGPPIRPEGDYVGHVLRIDQDTCTIGGWSFTTVLDLNAIRGVWARDEAPNPCICGTLYEREARRP